MQLQTPIFLLLVFQLLVSACQSQSTKPTTSNQGTKLKEQNKSQIKQKQL